MRLPLSVESPTLHQRHRLEEEKKSVSGLHHNPGPTRIPRIYPQLHVQGEEKKGESIPENPSTCALHGGGTCLIVERQILA